MTRIYSLGDKYKITIEKDYGTEPYFDIDDKRKNKNAEYNSKGNLYRARETVRELALCNEWDWFFTATFSKDKVRDRYDLGGLHSRLAQWLRDMRKSHGWNVKWLIVPERHKDGAIHFHGLLQGSIPLRDFTSAEDRNGKKRHSGYSTSSEMLAKFGFNSFGRVRSQEGVANYITKYITKSFDADNGGRHRYFASLGLLRKVLRATYYNEPQYSPRSVPALRDAAIWHWESDFYDCYLASSDEIDEYLLLLENTDLNVVDGWVICLRDIELPF